MLHTLLSPYLYLIDSEKTQLSMLLPLFANFSYELFSLWRPTHRDGWGQRQCFTPCSHLISTETGNAVETSWCQNKSKFVVNTALQVYPWDFISPLESGRSSVKVAREAGRSWIIQENATTISSSSSSCFISFLQANLLYISVSPLCSFFCFHCFKHYGHSLNMDTPIIQTISFVPTKISYHLYRITRLLRKPVNTYEAYFSVSQVRNSYTSSIKFYRR